MSLCLRKREKEPLAILLFYIVGCSLIYITYLLFFMIYLLFDTLVCSSTPLLNISFKPPLTSLTYSPLCSFISLPIFSSTLSRFSSSTLFFICFLYIVICSSIRHHQIPLLIHLSALLNRQLFFVVLYQLFSLLRRHLPCLLRCLFSLLHRFLLSLLRHLFSLLHNYLPTPTCVCLVTFLCFTLFCLDTL